VKNHLHSAVSRLKTRKDQVTATLVPANCVPSCPEDGHDGTRIVWGCRKWVRMRPKRVDGSPYVP